MDRMGGDYVDDITIILAKLGKVTVLCGLGAAPLSEEAMGYYYEHGIPALGGGGGTGDLAEHYYKAAPVPGFVDLCCTCLRLFGTISSRR